MSYISNHTGQAIDEAVVKVSQLLDLFYPVGAIYISTKNTNPATTLGGTWTQIKDKFLLTAGDSYSAGSTGGSATHTHTSAAHTHTTAGHTLTANEIPSHSHSTYGQVPRINENVGISNQWGHSTSSGDWWFQTVASSVQATGGGASHNHGNTGSTTPGNTGSSSNLPPI